MIRPILHAFPDVLSWLLLLLKKLNNFSTHYYSILFLTTKEEKKNFQIDEIEMTPVECAQKWQKHIKIEQE
mgnify:CR=1 FL=1